MGIRKKGISQVVSLLGLDGGEKAEVRSENAKLPGYLFRGIKQPHFGAVYP